MTTLTDIGVTKAKLRAYGHDGKFEALTGPQLQGVCCHMKALLDKKEGKYKRWSKSVAKEMRGIGVTQDQRSGEPTITYRKAKVVENISVSLEDFNRVEDELQAAKETINQLKDAELLKSEKGGFDKPGKIDGEVNIKLNKLVTPDKVMAAMAKDLYSQKVLADMQGGIIEPKPKRKRRTKAQIEADKAK